MGLLTRLSRAQTEREAYHEVARALAFLTAVARVSLAVVCPDGQSVEVIALSGCAAELPQGKILPLEHTAMARALELRRSYAWRIGSHPEFLENDLLADPGLREAINFPLIVGESAIGTLNLAGGSLHQNDLHTAYEVAAMLAATLERLKLVRRLAVELEAEQVYIKKLEVLSELSAKLSGATSRDEAFRLVFERLGRILPVGRMSIVSLSGPDEVTVVLVDGHQAVPVGSRIPPSAVGLSPLVNQARPVFLPDLSKSSSPVHQTLVKAGFRCAASLPLIALGKVVGALNLASCDPDLLAPKSKGLLQVVGVGLGATIERVAAEDRLREAQKLESLGVLSGGLAHDFNNLLGVALGNLSLVQDSLSSEHPLQAELGCIQQAIEKGAGLTRQMLAYAGKSTPETSVVDLNQAVLDLSGMMSPTLGKTVELRCELSQPGPTVMGDSSQLQQVLFNLITNAREAINGQGIITLKVDTLSVSADGGWQVEPGRYAWISCQDTGCGIAPQHLDRVFDPFFTTKARGSGLGLSTVLGVVRSHKGDLRVRSQPGQGCLVEVLLPMVTEAPRQVTGSGPLVYVVDDEQQLLRVASRMLERLGFEVCTASDGQELLDRLVEETRPVAAVLMDLSMPRMGGLEASRRLFESRGEVPIVLMSGYDREDSLRDGVQPNVKNFLAKPFRLEGLRAAMQAAVELPV